ncbi:hypothetical protein RB600_000948 [Gaeumannomyces tritici]
MPEEECANPLLLQWVKEWWELARERNSKGVTTYKHAYDSLKACPITFTHPSQLQQLRGFGPGLCGRLTDALKKHCETNGLPMPKAQSKSKAARAASNISQLPEGDVEAGPSEPAPKKPRKTKEYVPAYRTGAYALIMALSSTNQDAQVGLPKAELIELAQPHCDASFTTPSDPTKFYTAWNSMKSLLQKELVYERGRPLKRYALTDEGWDVALRVKETSEARGGSFGAAGPARQGVRGAGGTRTATTDPVPAQTRAARADADDVSEQDEASEDRGEPQPPPHSQYSDVVSDGPGTTSDDSSLPTFTPIRLPPGSFKVHLVLDVREVRAKTDRDYMQQELAKKGITPIMRSLELGDALWVAKCDDPALLGRAGAEGDEVVLDHIAERKRLDDLVSSVKDGRFHEQKFRLRRSGVRNVVYIVEEIAMDGQYFQRYEDMVESAIASTQVVNGFFLKRTLKMDETIAYLARLTRVLRARYETRTLHVIPTRVLTAKNYLPLLAHLRGEQDVAAAAAAAATGAALPVPAAVRDYYISYPAFASLASKSDMMTLRDVYLKMLMCTKGITGDKAIEIQKRWPTPYDFVKAFEACGGNDEASKKRKREMVSGQMASLLGRKKVTKAFSQKLAEVWGDA